MRKFRAAALIATTCLLAAGNASTAGATTIVTDFTASGSWSAFGSGSGAPPFGLSTQPTLQGSFTLTDGVLTGLDYSTGTQAWTLADVSSSAFTLGAGGVTQFELFFSSGNGVDSHNFATVYDGTNGEVCNNCVSFTSGVVAGDVPEPGTWAMMLLGLGAVGFAMRRKRASTLAQTA